MATIGIFGAGKLGIVLGQLARKAGYDVIFTGSGKKNISLTIDVLVPGARTGTWDEVASQSTWVILALPLGKIRNLPRDLFTKQEKPPRIIDATNYWWEVDGPRDSILPSATPSSVMVRDYFTRDALLPFYKAFSHMGYHHLHDEAYNPNAPKAIAYATSQGRSDSKIEKIIALFGFDSLYVGTIEESSVLEPGSPAFGATLSREELKALLD